MGSLCVHCLSYYRPSILSSQHMSYQALVRYFTTIPWKQFTSRYEVGEEVGRGHFGYTCSAWFKKPMPKGKEEFTATHSPLEEKGNMSRGPPDNVLWVGTFLLLSQLKQKVPLEVQKVGSLLRLEIHLQKGNKNFPQEWAAI